MGKKMRLTEEGERLTEEERNQLLAAVELLHDAYVPFNELQVLQGGLKKMEVEYQKRLSELEEDHQKKVKDFYGKRDGTIEKIPKFWVKSFLGHTELREALTDMDREILEHLESFHVDSAKDYGFIITLGFDQNPFFQNRELIIPYLDNSKPASKIDWKITVTQGSVKLFNDSLWTHSDDIEYTDHRITFSSRV